MFYSPSSKQSDGCFFHTIYFRLKYIKRVMNFPRSSSPASYSCQLMMLPHSLFLISPCCGGRRESVYSCFLPETLEAICQLHPPSTCVCVRARHTPSCPCIYSRRLSPFKCVKPPVVLSISCHGSWVYLRWRSSISPRNIGGAAADKHYDMRLQLLLTPSHRPGKKGEGEHWE